MRKSKRSTLKRGRKRGVLKAKNVSKNGRSKKKVSKAKKGGKSKGRVKNKSSAMGSTEAPVAPPKKRRGKVAKGPQDVENSEPESKKLRRSNPVQERVGEGRSWRYSILPNQVFGCRSCRFIFGGCGTCKKAGFRGRTAAMVREEEKIGEGDVSGGVGEEKQEDQPQVPNVEKGGKKKRRKVTKTAWRSWGLGWWVITQVSHFQMVKGFLFYIYIYIFIYIIYILHIYRLNGHIKYSRFLL